MGALITMGVVAVLVIFIVAKGLTIVRQAECMVIERLGRYHATFSSGINVMIPILDNPRDVNWRYVQETGRGQKILINKTVKRIDLRETVYDFPRQNVITKDNVVTEINALLYFQITDAVKMAYEIANLPDAIEKLTQTTLRNVIGELDLDGVLSSRDTINTKLRAILDEATDKWGVKVNRVELQDINPPADIRAAMEKQMRAERDRRAIILQAEGEKRSQILEAEGAKEAAINRAEGDKRAAVLRAEGDAEARIKVAQAEAVAVNSLIKVFEGQKADPTNYLVAVRYIEALQAMVSGQGNKVVYMPYEATGVLGSVGGIKEMFDQMKG